MFVKQAFEGEYPKLLRLYNDLWRRLHQFSATMTSILPVGGIALPEADLVNGTDMDVFPETYESSDFE